MSSLKKPSSKAIWRIIVGLGVGLAAFVVIYSIATYQASPDTSLGPEWPSNTQDFEPLLLVGAIFMAIVWIFFRLSQWRLHWLVLTAISSIVFMWYGAICAAAGQWLKTIIVILCYVVFVVTVVVIKAIKERNWRRNAAGYVVLPPR